MKINIRGKTVPVVPVPEMSAGDIRGHALKILNERNIEAWIQNNVTIRGRKFIGRKGVCDIMGYHRLTGLITACEVKKIGDTFKKDQIEMLTKIHKAGGIALQARQEGLKVIVKNYIEK